MVEKETIITDVWRLFYDRLKDTVSKVELSDDTTQEIQFYTTSYPDTAKIHSTDYPVLMVASPEINWEDFTFGKKETHGEIDVHILTTKKEAAERFIAQIINSIEEHVHNLRQEGLRFVNVDGTDYTSYTRGQIKLHERQVTFSFNYIFTKTRGY